MITEEQVIEAKRIIKQFESEQRELRRVIVSKNATTSIQEEYWGVHRTHCCFQHGCKYGDDDCPVVLGIIKQEYPCEDCMDDSEND